MIAIKAVKIVFCDVDDTLVKWVDDDKKYVNTVEWEYEAGGKRKTRMAVINIEVIEDIKRHKMRGHTVVVWSAGSGEWAEKAVQTLGIEDWVDYSMPKPDWLIDDKNPEEFMPKPKWSDFQ